VTPSLAEFIRGRWEIRGICISLQSPLPSWPNCPLKNGIGPLVMIDTQPRASNFGKWMALAAALLGWLFDGLEMGLFPLVARPALEELLPQEEVGRWIGVITALFLVGAATGGVLFGW